MRFRGRVERVCASYDFAFCARELGMMQNFLHSESLIPKCCWLIGVAGTGSRQDIRVLPRDPVDLWRPL